MNLKHGEWSTVANALRIAATTYGDDAVACANAKQPRLADQFARQQRDAQHLADRIESVYGL